MSKLGGRLGFRNLKDLNSTLLAKQVWRAVHDKDSLIFRVFKAIFQTQLCLIPLFVITLATMGKAFGERNRLFKCMLDGWLVIGILLMFGRITRYQDLALLRLLHP